MSIYGQHLVFTFPYVEEVFPEDAELLISLLLSPSRRDTSNGSSFAVTTDSRTMPTKVRLWLSNVSYDYLKEKGLIDLPTSS